MTSIRFAVLCLLAAPMFAEEPGLPNFHQVDAHVFRGRQPTREGFASLAKMGVKTVIDLRGGGIHGPREEKIVRQAGMQYVEERLSGIMAPRDEQIARLLAVMQDPSAAPVFVHCRRGADRVGVVIACYRIAHDHWSNERALAEARSVGMSRFEVLMQRYISRFDPVRANVPVAKSGAGFILRRASARPVF
jgi:tyrosine-protein phosphatase SIW14